MKNSFHTFKKFFFFPKLRTFHMTYMKSIRHSYFWHVHIKFYWDTSKLIHLCMYYVCLAISDYVESWEVMARFYSQNPMWVVTWTFIKPKEKKKKGCWALSQRKNSTLLSDCPFQVPLSRIRCSSTDLTLVDCASCSPVLSLSTSSFSSFPFLLETDHMLLLFFHTSLDHTSLG